MCGAVFAVVMMVVLTVPYSMGSLLSRESGQDMERLLLLDAEELGLEAESCSMGKAAVNASNTSGQINLQRNLVLPKEYVSDY
jgi:hypothetical protein